jgi:hypothetical protein
MRGFAYTPAMSRLARNAVRFVLFSSLVAAAACSKAESRGTDVGAPPTQTAAAPAGERVAVPGETVAVPGAPGAAPTAAPAGAPAGNTPDSSFKLAVAAPAPGAVGAQAVARVTVTPGTGWKMNEEYPTKLVVQAPDGVTVVKAEQVLADAAAFDPHQLAFDVKVTAAKAGTYPVTGTLKFAVCTDATCDPKKQTIAFDVVAN